MAELVLKIKTSHIHDAGDILEAYSDADIALDWAQMLARGTAPAHLELPFIPELFNKYCRRLCFNYATKQLIPIKTPSCNFRQEPFIPGVMRFVDQWLPDIKTDELLADVNRFFGTVKRYSTLDPTRHLFKTKTHGIEDLKKFMVLFIPDSEFIDAKEIRALTQELNGRRRRYRINYPAVTGSNRTLQSVTAASSESANFKSWLSAIRSEYHFTNTTSLQTVFEDDRVSIPPRFDLTLPKNIILDKAHA